jgi:hypothetical protein
MPLHLIEIKLILNIKGIDRTKYIFFFIRKIILRQNACFIVEIEKKKRSEPIEYTRHTMQNQKSSPNLRRIYIRVCLLYLCNTKDEN